MLYFLDNRIILLNCDGEILNFFDNNHFDFNDDKYHIYKGKNKVVKCIDCKYIGDLFFQNLNNTSTRTLNNLCEMFKNVYMNSLEKRACDRFKETEYKWVKDHCEKYIVELRILQ